MKQSIITNERVHTRVTNLIASKIKGAVSIFSNAPTVNVEDGGGWYKTIIVKNEDSHMLTFAEIDIVREVVDEYCKKYKGMFYIMGCTPYVSRFDNETVLYMPSMEINVRKYDKDEIEK